MRSTTLQQVLWGLAIVLLQILLFRHLQFFGTHPDLILVYLLWIIATRDRTTALVAAAGTGFLQDLFLDQWGLNMMAKTLTTFLIYNFFPKVSDARMMLYQIFILVLLASLVHNLVYLGVALFADIFAADAVFWRFWIGNSIFTAVLGTFIYMFKFD